MAKLTNRSRRLQTDANKEAEQLTALAKIETDFENVRTTWDWAVEQGQVE